MFFYNVLRLMPGVHLHGNGASLCIKLLHRQWTFDFGPDLCEYVWCGCRAHVKRFKELIAYPPGPCPSPSTIHMSHPLTPCVVLMGISSTPLPYSFHRLISLLSLFCRCSADPPTPCRGGQGGGRAHPQGQKGRHTGQTLFIEYTCVDLYSMRVLIQVYIEKESVGLW
jgi:hypothetical protein